MRNQLIKLMGPLLYVSLRFIMIHPLVKLSLFSSSGKGGKDHSNGAQFVLDQVGPFFRTLGAAIFPGDRSF